MSDRTQRRLLARSIALKALIFGIFAASLGGCKDPELLDRTHFRVNGDKFEIDRGNGWEPFYPRGVNLAVGKPGTYPGELAATYDDYMRYFAEIQAMNANVIRLYTLHHPRFYKALSDYNIEHQSNPLYFIQGIWLDELEPDGKHDYMSDSTPQIQQEIRYVVDAVYGQATIIGGEARWGKAYGEFQWDTSPWLMAWLPGHEMDGNMAKLSNEKFASFTEYHGKYISKKDGKPIEAWVAQGLDYTVATEMERYGQQHPVAWSNWPALDPIHHPTETPQFGQDVTDANLAKFDVDDGFTAGIYASYHVYPFNPEFIIYDPGYLKSTDRNGKVNSYLGYMRDLVKAHEGVPVFVTEYGVPSSFGVAHVNPNGGNHGGYTEAEQATLNVELYEAIVDSGGAGAVIFEWMDEWFKRTWMTNTTMLPPSRGRLWYDVCSPEESFGIVSYYPVPGQSVRVDGDLSDWPKTAFVTGEGSGPLKRVRVHHDPAFLFISIETSGVGNLLTSDKVLMIGLDTVDQLTGDRKWPLDLKDSKGISVVNQKHRGMENVVIVDPANQTLRLRVQKDYDPTGKLNGEAKIGGRPTSTSDGKFIDAAWIINNDQQYIAAGGIIAPKKRYYEPGKLFVGDSQLQTKAHVYGRDGVLELRLPWQALWVTDPSSRQVLYDTNEDAWNYEHRTTEGIAVMTVLAEREGGKLLMKARLPAGEGGFSDEAQLYTWKPWEKVSEAGRRMKPLYDALRDSWAKEPEKML